MPASHDFLTSLATVLGVAAVTTVLFQRLHLPVVFGYLIAGLIIGPHVPIPLVADASIVHTLSELGVILLMFSIGLEFSLTKLFRIGPTAAVTAVVQTSLMMWLGFLAGRLFGWTTTECVFTGAIVAISSTTIVTKAFDEQRVSGRLREIVVGVLVVQDLLAVLLLATLTAVATGRGLSAGAVLVTVGRLAAFLVGLVVVGLLVVPRGVRAVAKLDRPETTLVASIGFCFAVALLAQAFGYSVALGAVLAGSLIAESGEHELIEHLVQPVRDMFAAIFFVSVGMLIDPVLIAQHWPAVIVLTFVVVVGQMASVSFGAFLTGNGVRTSVQAGMSLAQIGEFSFIIAGLGLSLGATGSFLYPIAVAVSAVTTLCTPWLIRASGPAASWVDRRSPRAVQTFTALYASWAESVREGSERRSARYVIRRLVRLLLVDAVLVTAIVVGTAASIGEIGAWLGERLAVGEAMGRLLVIVGASVLCAPFCLGVVRVSRKLGTSLGEMAFRRADPSKADQAAAPRRAYVVTVQLAAVLLVAVPIVAVTQPFVSHWVSLGVLVALLALLGIAFWRSATNLQGHVRAGAEVIVEALALQARRKGSAAAPAPTLAPMHALLPGLGEPTPVRLDAASPAVGRTLAELNVRGLTGATVLAITRGEAGGGVVPTAREVLQKGDVLALAGTHAAVAAASDLLVGPRPGREEPVPATAAE